MSEVNINDKTIFIPKTNGNDKLEKPITFHVQFLTAAEQAEMEYFQYSAVKGSDSKVNIRVDNRYIFLRGVTLIDNWDGGTKPEEFINARGKNWYGKMLVEVSAFIYESMGIDEKN
jgi:hypothetical protein